LVISKFLVFQRLRGSFVALSELKTKIYQQSFKKYEQGKLNFGPVLPKDFPFSITLPSRSNCHAKPRKRYSLK
jgi:hypothetical protein